MMRRLIATAVLMLAVAAPARAGVLLQVNAESDRGFISVAILSSPAQPDVTLYERVAGRLREIAHPQTTPGNTPWFGPVNYAALPDILRWSCQQRTRTLVGVARAADGTESRTEYQVRTPSCANRLVMTVRPRAVTVRDTWGLGGLAAQVCTPRGCKAFVLGDGTAEVTRAMRSRRGDVVTLYSPWARRSTTLGARSASGPTVLLTGDSMMQSLDAVLEDRLARTADVEPDVRPGTGLSSTFMLSWPELARQQVSRLHPHATVLFLGTNDSFAMDGVPCCGPDWSALYQQRARALMRTYAQNGAGRVVWLTVPLARDPQRRPAALAINRALVAAAATVPGVTVIPADRIFTPGGRYRDTISYRGRTVDVRADDGIHLSLAGGGIAADYVIAALKRAGVL